MSIFEWLWLFMIKKYLFYLRGHEIAGALFNCDLVGKRIWHPSPVPIQPPFVVVVSVEEMHLAVRLLHRLVQEQHLQQRPSAAFPHTNDDCLQKLENTNEFQFI